MNITIVAATRLEVREEMFVNSDHNISFLYTGVGMLSAAVQITREALMQKPGLMLQIGIAGSFTTSLPPGSVVMVQEEKYGDTGVWENGEWKDIFDMNFAEADEPPFSHKSLPNDEVARYNVTHLPLVTGVTINEITTQPQTICLLPNKYGAHIETMEGAALHYVCRLLHIPFLQLRGISNHVGERNKQLWNIKDAVIGVNEAALHLISQL